MSNRTKRQGGVVCNQVEGRVGPTGVSVCIRDVVRFTGESAASATPLLF